MTSSLNRRPIRRLAIATVCALSFFAVSLAADGNVCGGDCSCECSGLFACAYCVNIVVDSCCGEPSPAGCCNAQCIGEQYWEVSCLGDGSPWVCEVSLPGQPCIE
jgi:hypothetical protein